MKFSWRICGIIVAAALVGTIVVWSSISFLTDSVDRNANDAVVEIKPRGTDFPSAQKADQDATYARVKVFYATDRNKIKDNVLGVSYGTNRSGLTYGICEVSIPRDHRMGELEAPSVWKLEFRNDPEKHVVLLSVEEWQKKQFFEQLRTKIGASNEAAAFLFVHGYNTSFEYAARRTAQMHYDLGFSGAPIFYSWPSQASEALYPNDETNNKWTEPHLLEFLADLFATTRAKKIYLVAHSMGSRALTNAIAVLVRENPQIRNKLQAVILAAPDIDADIFKRDIVPALAQSSKNVTLYVSSNDKALMASKQFHGYPRAGEAGDHLVVAEGLDTIDATNVNSSFVGHSSYAEANSIISDIFEIFRSGAGPQTRKNLKATRHKNGIHWVIQ